MVAITVVTIGVVGAYQIAFKGATLAATTENRIKAINIAREGLEIMENIRDTNWIKLSSDYKACWDVLNYDVTCIGSSTGASAIRINTASYVTGQNPNGTWTLIAIPSPSTVRGTYKTQFPIYLDADGLVSQSGAFTALCTPAVTSNCVTRFTRQIIVTRPADYSTIQIEAVVTWTEPGKDTPYEIRIPYTLYNWKYQFYSDSSTATGPAPVAVNCSGYIERKTIYLPRKFYSALTTKSISAFRTVPSA